MFVFAAFVTLVEVWVWLKEYDLSCYVGGFIY
jgi:hypothetical protein